MRKLLDLQKPYSNETYPTLRLCCDWSVHIERRGPQAQKIVKKMDELYPQMLTGTLSEDGKRWIREIFSFGKFREELNQLFRDNKLPALSDSQWHSFLTGFLNNVEDFSLKCNPNAAVLNNVDEVVLFKEGRGLSDTPDASTPPLFWALCLGGKLRFPMIANAGLSAQAVQALVDLEKRREQVADKHLAASAAK